MLEIYKVESFGEMKMVINSNQIREYTYVPINAALKELKKL